MNKHNYNHTTGKRTSRRGAIGRGAGERKDKTEEEEEEEKWEE